MSGEFLASGNGRRLRAWRPPMSGPNSATNTETMLARVRDAVRNNPWVGAASEKRAANAIGVGIQAKATYGTPAQRAIQDALWLRSIKEIDADGVNTFYGQQELAWREWDEAGEIFARIRSRRPSDGLAVPMQVQLVESEQCPRGYFGYANNGNQIKYGIEFNAIGGRAAYWMYRTHPGDADWTDARGNDLVRVPAEQVIHLYRPMRAGQQRGISRMASVLILADCLNKLRDNTLDRSQLQNLFTGWFIPPLHAGEDSPLAEAQVGTDDDGTPIVGLEPGTMGQLPKGWDVKFSEPPDPGAEFGEFMRSQLLAFCSRVGIPYEVLAGDLRDVSDRALKLLLNEFRRIIESDQWLYMIPRFCQGIREAWFDSAVLNGKLQFANYAELRDEITTTLWMPHGWPWSHPVQDVEAEEKAVRAGFKSRTDVVLGTGEDPEEVDKQQQRDNARADKLGLRYSSDGRQSNKSPGAASGK